MKNNLHEDGLFGLLVNGNAKPEDQEYAAFWIWQLYNYPEEFDREKHPDGCPSPWNERKAEFDKWRAAYGV
jgi:hypothetical protein